MNFRIRGKKLQERCPRNDVAVENIGISGTLLRYHLQSKRFEKYDIYNIGIIYIQNFKISGYY